MIYLNTEKTNLPAISQKFPPQTDRSFLNKGLAADTFTSSKLLFKGVAAEEKAKKSFIGVLFGNVFGTLSKKNNEKYHKYNECLNFTPYKI